MSSNFARTTSELRMHINEPKGSFTLALPWATPGDLTDPCNQDPKRNYEVIMDSHNLNDRYVFRCRLRERQETDPATVILKTAKARVGEDETLLRKREKEATHYIRDLKALQGKEIPRFLGFYKGVDEKRGVTVACLLLEDCGTNLQSGQLEEHKYKLQLGKALARFHRRSRLSYNNISARHTLLRSDGRTVLINFNKVKTHDCKFPDGKIEGIKFSDIIGKRLPDPGTTRIPCDEVYRFCKKMELFVQSTYEYSTTKFTIHSGIRSREDLAKMVLEVYSLPEEKEDVILWSKQAWVYIEDDLGSYAQAPWASESRVMGKDQDDGLRSGALALVNDRAGEQKED